MTRYQVALFIVRYDLREAHCRKKELSNLKFPIFRYGSINSDPRLVELYYSHLTMMLQNLIGGYINTRTDAIAEGFNLEA